MTHTARFSSLALVILATGTFACSQSVEPESTDSSASALEAPAPPPGQAIFRAVNPVIGDHLQGLTSGEGAPAYQPEGIGFKVFPVQVPDSAPLFRCRWNGAHHFLSTSANCEGYTNEGVLGFVGTVPRAEFVPIVRCYNGVADHLTTTNPGECFAAGLRIEGVQGFAIP